MLTFKNGGDDVSATRINWSLDGGVFTSIGLIFNDDDVGGAWGTNDGMQKALRLLICFPGLRLVHIH